MHINIHLAARTTARAMFWAKICQVHWSNQNQPFNSFLCGLFGEKNPKIRNKKRAVGISLATGRHSAANQTSVLKPLRQNLTPVTRTPFNNESACGRGQIWCGAILTSPCSPASWEKLSEDRLKLELQQKYDKGESEIQRQHRWLCLRRGGRDLVKQ